MKANRIGDVVHTDRTLPAENMKDYCSYVCKNIPNRLYKKVRIFFVCEGFQQNCFFYSMLTLRKFKVLLYLSKINI